MKYLILLLTVISSLACAVEDPHFTIYNDIGFLFKNVRSFVKVERDDLFELKLFFQINLPPESLRSGIGFGKEGDLTTFSIGSSGRVISLDEKGDQLLLIQADYLGSGLGINFLRNQDGQWRISSKKFYVWDYLEAKENHSKYVHFINNFKVNKVNNGYFVPLDLYESGLGRYSIGVSIDSSAGDITNGIPVFSDKTIILKNDQK